MPVTMADNAVTPETQCVVFEPAWIRETAMECLRADNSVQELKFVTEEEDLVITDVSADGHLNNVLRVASRCHPTKSVIFKHAPPYWRVAPSSPLTDERGDLEYRAIQKFHSILPGSVPKPLAYNRTRKVVCMEDLRGYTLYRKWLLAGNVDKDVARTLARNIATIHSQTHVTNIGQEALQQLEKEFQNPELMKLLDSVIYVDPMIREKAVKHISPALKKQAEAVFADAELLKAMGDIRRVFLEKKEAFIHSDTHSSSVMVKGKDVRLFDLECARVGPCAKDLGQVLANYFFCYFHHLHHPDNDNQTHTRMVDTLPDICRATVEEYLNHLNVIVDDKDSFIRQLMSETAGFAAAQIFSRLLSIARVEDMDSMESAQPDALAAGCRLLKAHHSVHDVAAMMDLVLRHTS